MELEEYRELVRKAEREFATDPAALRRRVARFVALGYVYVWSILGIVAGALVLVLILMAQGHGVAVLWKVLVGLGALLVVILKALDVKFDAPTGIQVSREDAPRFHERVEEIRAALEAPQPDVVLLTDDFNAAVTRLPDRALGGAEITYLIIGLPLLYALTPAQFDAVLAHEFGHLSGSHPKHGLRVWRMARVWKHLASEFEISGRWGGVFFEDFFRWYIPRLYAMGFAMSRHDELEADADAARIAGGEAMGGALLALSVRGRYLQETFWPQLWSRAKVVAEPAVAWPILPQHLRDSDQGTNKREWIGNALLASADENDTHPSLRDRLTHLGLISSDAESQVRVSEQLLQSLEISAAEHYLPDFARLHLDAFERRWQESAAEPWAERFAAAEKVRARLEELQRRDAESNDLTLDELWEVAAGTAHLLGEVAALPAARRVLEVREDYAAAHVMMGIGMYKQGDDGESHLLRAMDLDQETTPVVVAVLGPLYDARGDEAANANLLARYQAWATMTNAANTERSQLAPGDTFEPPQLTPEAIGAVRQAAASTRNVRDVLVARKTMKYHTERPLFVMFLRRGWNRRVPLESVKAFMEHLSFPHDALVLGYSGELAWAQDALEDSGALRVTAAGNSGTSTAARTASQSPA